MCVLSSCAQHPVVMASVLVSALAMACDPPACPPGSSDMGGRCIPDVDARATDAFVRPDACTPMSLYPDTDRDGHGAPGSATLRCPARGWVSSSDDCDDENDERFLGADELCNGADEDCGGDDDAPEEDDDGANDQDSDD